MSRLHHAEFGLCKALIVSVVLLFFVIPDAFAKNWADGTANWSPGTWSPAGVPTTGEAVSIAFADGVQRTVTLNVSPPSLGLVTVDLTGAGTAVSELSMLNNNTLTVNGMFVGGYNGITATQTAGRGTFTQSAGTTTINSGRDFALGYGANSNGTYTLSGTGALVANQSEYIGIYGKGTFNQSAGTNTIANATGFFDIGEIAGSTGTYNLSGTGTLTVNTSEYVGDAGTGIFNQTGGTHTINGAGHNLYIGHSGGSGTYTLSAGALSVSNGAEYVGYASDGTFNQSGGTNTVGNLYVNYGTYSLSGGTLTCNSSETVNVDFEQNGGTNDIAGALYDNYIYNLGGTGSLSTVDETISVGVAWSVRMTQTGGTHTVTGNLHIGDIANTFGVYDLSGGQASVRSVFVGNSTGAVGYLTVSGTGVLNVTGALKAYSTSIPDYDLSTSLILAGGTINTPALDFSGTPSLFHWTSGKLNMTQSVTWDPAGATNTSVAFGSGLTLGNNQTLMVSGNETLGGTGAFGLTLNSGSTHTVTGGLTIAPNGALTLNGGTVNADNLVNNGSFAFLSGVLHITGVDGLTIGAGGLLGSAVVVNTAQTLSVTNTATVNSGAYLAVVGGFNSGNLVNNGDLVVINSAIGGPIVNNHTVTVVGTVNFNGLVSGPGGFFGPGTAHFNGGLAPGASPANLSFEGGLALADTNTLFIEIGGITPGSQHDRLTIAGSASLAGILNVSLINGFTPSAGQSFDILDWGSLSGTFSTLQLPTLTGGLTWNTSQIYTTGVLSVATAGLPGDYNHDGVVDDADYVTWRKGLGTIYTQADYDVWRSHFGQTAGSGSGAGANAAVPEPATLVMLIVGLLALCFRRLPVMS